MSITRVKSIDGSTRFVEIHNEDLTKSITFQGKDITHLVKQIIRNPKYDRPYELQILIQFNDGLCISRDISHEVIKRAVIPSEKLANSLVYDIVNEYMVTVYQPRVRRIQRVEEGSMIFSLYESTRKQRGTFTSNLVGESYEVLRSVPGLDIGIPVSTAEAHTLCLNTKALGLVWFSAKELVDCGFDTIIPDHLLVEVTKRRLLGSSR